MPFIKLANAHQKCDLPTTRDDGSPLVVGDEWRCEQPIASELFCGKTYRWVNDQRDGNCWAWIPNTGNW